MSEPIVAVIGEALMDVVDTGDGARFTAHVGGSPLNVATGLARLERPTAFLGRFSRDGFGRILRGYAEGAGVNLDAAPDADERSTIAVVHLDDRGVARYDFTVEGTADWGWTADELAALPASVRLLHWGSLASWLPPGDAVIGAFVDSLRARGDVVISYDPNVRPGLLGEASEARGLVEPRVAAAHVVKASSEDLDWLYPGVPHPDVAAQWLALGARLVFVTCGGYGTTAYRSGGEPITRPALPIDPVDTIGAGDAFTSGLLDALLRAGVRSPGDLDGIGARAVVGLLDEAAVVAGLTCARAGANPPTRSEVRDFLAGGR
ncbi:carbohydrate kinase (plasmid) [Embleya sp. NBC_00888]|uniref:carbohydrate kinase family protein n=1 Tax=Embleya sp. NBC_00888 TaxID=2975960 RepID=UPI002F913D22|nr:carbohydrate kinase [Embleya sp. NBC_00888]